MKTIDWVLIGLTLIVIYFVLNQNIIIPALIFLLVLVYAIYILIKVIITCVKN